MAVPTIGDGAILSYLIDSRLDGQQILLTTHWMVSDVSGLDLEVFDAYAGLDTTLDDDDELVAKYRLCQANSVTSGSQIVQCIHPQRYVRQVRSSAHPDGTIDTPCNVPNRAAVITLKGPTANRHNLGIKHIAGVPDANFESGMVTGAGQALLDSLAEKLIGPRSITTPDGDTYTATPLIFNRTTPASSVEPLLYDVGNTARVMRRRTVGHGS